MAAILVILMVIAFFAIDALKLYLKRRRGEATGAEPVRTFGPVKFPKGLFLGENHSWARLTELGELKVGMDELLSQALGGADVVDVVPVGTHLAKGDTIAVVTRLGRHMEVTSPVDGTLVAANEHVLNNPEAVSDDPYGSGWLASVWPVEHNEALRELKVGERAAIWLGREVQRFTDFLTERTSPALVGAVAADGAHPVLGAACSLDGEGWTRFAAEFTGRDT